MLDTRARRYFQKAFDVTANFLKLINLHPNVVTIIAFILGMVAFVFLIYELPLYSLLFLWLSGIFDVLDGTVARLTGKSSKIGAYLDMLFDRMIECAIILGFYFFLPQFALSYLLFFTGMIFNFTTFVLAGALFENNGSKSMHYDIGLVERTEWFIFISVMMIFPSTVPVVLNIFNALMVITGLLRIIRIIKHEKSSNE